MNNKIFSREEFLNLLKEGKEISISKSGFATSKFIMDKNDKILYQNEYLTSANFFEHPKTLSEILDHFEKMQKEGATITVSERNESKIKSLFLKTKGITREEYDILSLDSKEELGNFIEEMAEKYPGGSVSRKDPSDEFIQFITKEIEKDEYIPNFPILLMKDRDVSFLKYENGYSVDINSMSVGMSVCFTESLEEAKTFYDKEKFFSKIQMADNNILDNINYINSTFGQNYNMAIICDEEIFGRRTTLIDYFNNELAHAEEFYPDEKDEIDKQNFINKTNEIIEELKNSKSQLEPVYLFIHPMDNAFHIANEEEQLENIKGLYEDVYEELLELPDSEEQDEGEDEL